MSSRLHQCICSCAPFHCHNVATPPPTRPLTVLSSTAETRFQSYGPYYTEHPSDVLTSNPLTDPCGRRRLFLPHSLHSTLSPTPSHPDLQTPLTSNAIPHRHLSPLTRPPLSVLPPARPTAQTIPVRVLTGTQDYHYEGSSGIVSGWSRGVSRVTEPTLRPPHSSKPMTVPTSYYRHLYLPLLLSLGLPNFFIFLSRDPPPALHSLVPTPDSSTRHPSPRP